MCLNVFCMNQCDTSNMDELFDNVIKWDLTEITEILLADNLHILAISETHLDSTFEDGALLVRGFSMFRRDGNAFGGGFLYSVHIPVKIRHD